MADISLEQTSHQEQTTGQQQLERCRPTADSAKDVPLKITSDSFIRVSRVLQPEGRVSLPLRHVLRRYRGWFYMVLSSICFASLGVFIQLVPSVHSLELSSIRAIFLIFLPAIGLIISRSRHSPIAKISKSTCFYVVLNGIMSTAVLITSFISYSLAPVGDVNAIIYSSPLVSGILAWIFLKEKLTIYDVILTIVAIAGVVLVTQPVFVFGKSYQVDSDSHFIGALWAIAALLCLSFLSVITRKIRSNDSSSASVLTLTFGLVALPTSAILNTFLGEWTLPVKVHEIVLLIAVGIVGFLAPHTFSLALKSIKTVSGAVVRTLVIVLSYVLQFLVFRTYPNVITGIGVVLILSATFGVFVLKWRESMALEYETDKKGNVDEEAEDNSATKEAAKLLTIPQKV